MKRCRCMALDLDGTLLASDGRLTKESKEALAAAIAEGVHVVVASGRAYATLPESVLSVPGIEYAITSNGAAIYRVSDSSCLCVHKLKPETVRQIIALAEEVFDTPLFEAFVDGTAYAPADYVENPEKYEADAGAVAYIRATRNPCEDFYGFLEEHIGELDSLDVVTADSEKKEQLWNRIEEQVEHVYVTASVPRLLEISDEKSGKAPALAYVLNLLDIPVSQAAAFGNADNDADMLAYAGYGVAVANATEACLAAADKIAAHNDEHGAAKEILRILQEGI